MSIEIESADVIRLIQQYLKESNLTKTLQTLQEETGVSLNTVESVDAFCADIHAGQWDAVLAAVAPLKLPEHKLLALHEHVVLELLELRELAAARALLRQAPAGLLLKQRCSERYVRLESLASRSYFDPREAYGAGGGKERRRAALAADLSAELSVVPASRLLALLGQALQWQGAQGLLPPGAAIDVFRGRAAVRARDDDAVVATLARTVRFGSKAHVESARFSPDGQLLVTGSVDGLLEVCDVTARCSSKAHVESARFSPDGQLLVTGSVDGLLEVWNFATGRLRRDVRYQAQDRCMAMDAAALALGWARDSDALAAGDAAGDIKVWRVGSGALQRKLPRAHSKGVTCVVFARDGAALLSAGFDRLVRLHGLRSGRLLKEFRGHTGFVNDAVFTSDAQGVLSASSDGTVRVWCARSGECTAVWRPGGGAGAGGAGGGGGGAPALALLPLSNTAEHVAVVTRGASVAVLNAAGQLVRSLAAATGAVLTCGALAARGALLYAASEDGAVFAWDAARGSLLASFAAHSAPPVGLAHHPAANLLASYAEDGLLKLWKP